MARDEAEAERLRKYYAAEWQPSKGDITAEQRMANALEFIAAQLWQINQKLPPRNE